MSVLIIGSEGSMGKRYQAILRHLGKPFKCIDKNDSFPDIIYDGYIIATPTETHAYFVSKLVKTKKPILVEKPVSKNLNEVRFLLNECEAEKVPIRMMQQYDVLSCSGEGLSFYNYFRHGNDGLVWDCMQIIGAARGEIALYEDSPIWQCTLNGNRLSSADMDHAYVKYVELWYRTPGQNISEILSIHEKTDAIARSGRYG